jgi:hypothetical protein
MFIFRSGWGVLSIVLLWIRMEFCSIPVATRGFVPLLTLSGR